MFSIIPKRYLVHRHSYPSIRPWRSQPHGRTAAVVPDRNSRRGRKKRGTSAPLRDRREALPEEGKSNLLFQPLFFPPYLPTRALQAHLGQLVSCESPRRAAPVPAGSAAERPGAVRNTAGGEGGPEPGDPQGGGEETRRPPAARAAAAEGTWAGPAARAGNPPPHVEKQPRAAPATRERNAWASWQSSGRRPVG